MASNSTPQHTMTSHCCEHHTTSSVTQTLNEMDFERGLWSAALDGDLERVEKLVGEGRDVNGLDSSGYTPLHYASRNGHSDVAAALLSHRACANAQTRSGHVTPLHRAAYCGHIDVINILLRHTADVTLRDSDGKNALHKAYEKGNAEVIKLLLKKDRDVLYVRDNRGNLPQDYTSDPVLLQLL